MAFKTTELISMGYERQAVKLAKQLRDNHKTYQMEQARQWSAIGQVNDSFFDVTDKDIFTREDIHKALNDLGVKIEHCKGKKWFQFWLKDYDVKFLNAIKKIP